MHWLDSQKFIFCFFLIVSFVVFGNGIKGHFVYDDQIVLSHPDLLSFTKIPRLFVQSYHYVAPETGIYRPLTTVSYALNFSLFGRGPVSFHITNIILNALVAFVIFLLLQQLFKEKKFAFIVSVLFLVLPIHVEAVTSIVGRAELLMALFLVLAIFWRDKIWLSSLVFGLSLLSKETAVAFVPIVVFTFYYVDRLAIRLIVKRLLWYLAPLGFYFMLRFVALGTHIFSNNADMAFNPIKYAGFPSNVFTSLKVLALYIYKTFIPLHLASDYSFNQITIVSRLLGSPEALLGLVLIVLFSIVLFMKQIPTEIRLGSLLFLAPYVVISNIFFKTGTIMAERLMFLPSLGLIMIAVYVGQRYVKKMPRMLGLSVIMLLLLYSGITYARNRVWLTQEALLTDAYQKSPHSVIAQLGMAQVHMARGEQVQAKALLEQAQATYDKNPEILNLLGIIAWNEKDYARAESYFQKILELNPKNFNALVNVSRMYYQQKKYAQTHMVLEQLLAIWGREVGIQNIRLLLVAANQARDYGAALKAVEQAEAFGIRHADFDFLKKYAAAKKGDRKRLEAIGHEFSQ